MKSKSRAITCINKRQKEKLRLLPMFLVPFCESKHFLHFSVRMSFRMEIICFSAWLWEKRY